MLYLLNLEKQDVTRFIHIMDADVDIIKLVVQSSLKCLMNIIGENMHQSDDNYEPLYFKSKWKNKSKVVVHNIFHYKNFIIDGTGATTIFENFYQISICKK